MSEQDTTSEASSESMADPEPSITLEAFCEEHGLAEELNGATPSDLDNLRLPSVEPQRIPTVETQAEANGSAYAAKLLTEKLEQSHAREADLATKLEAAERERNEKPMPWWTYRDRAKAAEAELAAIRAAAKQLMEALKKDRALGLRMYKNSEHVLVGDLMLLESAIHRSV